MNKNRGIFFLLPGKGRSGGVRVTVEMGNRLLDRGYDVTILCRIPSIPTLPWLKNLYNNIIHVLAGYHNDDWIPFFKGNVLNYSHADDIDVPTGSVVIGVGDMCIMDVHAIREEVVKMRYCHENPNLNPSYWCIPMKTIAVSAPLVPLLEPMTGEKDIPVVPNGINTGEYFPENVARDGIGIIYHSTERKAPDFTIDIINAIHERFPGVPVRVFSMFQKPAGLKVEQYIRYPSIEDARVMYSRSLVWVIPSRSEGFCLPMLEAMGCGCAVVSTDHDTARGIIHDGENGLLVPVDDLEGMMRAIKRVLGDEELKNRLVNQGFMTVRTYSWDTAVDLMEKVLDSIE